MKTNQFLLVSALVLAGCNNGDEGDGFQPVGDPQNIVVNSQNSSAIHYSFQSAGNYELRVTGAISCQQSPAVLNVWTNPTGAVAVSSGDPQLTYELQTCAPPVKLDQRVIYSVTGTGPWLVDVWLAPVPIAGVHALSVGPGPGLVVNALQLSLRRVN